MNATQRNTMEWIRAHWVEMLIFALMLIALSVSPSSLAAEQERLPSGEKVLDDAAKATGSKKARGKLRNRVVVSSLDLAGQGLSLRMTIHSAPPNLNYTVIESELTGKIEKGTDGEVVWELSELMGAQIKEGQEKADFLREARFDRLADWRELYTEAECTGVESIADHPAYRVRLTTVDGTEQTMYFDTESKLPVKHEFVLENPMGSIPIETWIGDYREVDGLRWPHEMKAVVMGQERRVTTESVEHNVELPSDRFDLPPAIQELLAKS
jgi:hypothetical protein